MSELSRVEDLLKDGVEEPVLPMSELEAILRGEHVKPHSRVAELLLQYNPKDILIEKRIEENGTYYASVDNADGYFKVIVDTPVVPPVVLDHLVETITQNGEYTYTPEHDGYSDAAITVAVPDSPAVIQSLNIDENGTYTAPSGVDGFSPIVANVPSVNYKSASNLPTAIATVSDAVSGPIKSLKASIDSTGWTSCEVNRTGKNILSPYDSGYENATIKSDGTYTTGNNRIVTGFIRCGGGVEVRASGEVKLGTNNASFSFAGIASYDSNMNFIERSGGNNLDVISYTTPSNTAFIRFFEQIANETLVTPQAFATYKQQLELGSEATAYQAFGNTYTILFTDGTNPVTVYDGSIDITGGTWTGKDSSDNTVSGTFTPLLINTLAGSNSVYANCGNITEFKYLYGSNVPSPSLDSITITENGHYTPPTGTDGYDNINVEVPDIPAILDDITITENGNYTPPSGTDGYDDITVQVPGYFKQTLSGLPSPIATFTGADAPLDSLKASIEGVQDLHGYDKPWAGGAGKNKYHTTVTGRTNNGVTYTTNESSITATGTATATSYAFNNNNWTYSNSILLKAGTYTISTNQITGSAFGVVKVSENGGAESYIVEYTNNDSATFTLSEDTYIAVNLRISNGTTVNTTFYIQIESGETATSWTSYSNICPISGWTSCEVTKTGKNLNTIKYTPRTYSVVTYSVSDGVLSIQGTITTENAWSVSDRSVTQSDCILLKAGTYTINKTNVTGIRFYPRALSSLESIGYSTRNESLTFSLPSDTWIYVNVRADSGFSSETPVTLNIQIERGEEETTFEPYSGNTYTIPFKDSSDNPITVYDGGIDISGGKLTVTHANIASYNGETINEPWISSEDIYTQGATPTIGAQVVYPLTTPLVYDFDPLALRSNGVTNISVDCGEVTECKYYSETP